MAVARRGGSSLLGESNGGVKSPHQSRSIKREVLLWYEARTRSQYWWLASTRAIYQTVHVYTISARGQSSR
jgi:hypothetical protein